jgi:hypothetical protein
MKGADMANEWDDLPNAKHIDRVLNRGRARRSEWADARIVTRKVEWDTAWKASWDAALKMLRGSIWDEVWNDSRGVGMGAVALVAWDDCAYILDLHPDVVRTLAGAGNPAAVLLLPAVIAMYEEKP